MVHIAALARQLADEINAGGAEGRELLRDIAVGTLRDEVVTVEPVVQDTVRAGSFNPFGIGIPLLLVGGLLVFIFPPVGLLLFGVAIVALAWGVLAALFTRR